MRASFRGRADERVSMPPIWNCGNGEPRAAKPALSAIWENSITTEIVANIQREQNAKLSGATRPIDSAIAHHCQSGEVCGTGGSRCNHAVSALC